jgi:Spy/CpxP family protein refolding chaperone
LPAKSNILFCLLVGASCLLIGFALSTLAYRYHYLRVPGSWLIERMNHELNLTPAQRDRIGDILRDTRVKVTQARQDFEHRRHQLFLDGLGQVRGVLTPEQQKIFDRDFTQPWAHRRHGGHGGHGGDGDHMPLEEGAPPQAPPQPPPVPQN